ncbi:MAG: hypothetical protein H7839_10925 [Magnetococcus sp. YQC-5]
MTLSAGRVDPSVNPIYQEIIFLLVMLGVASLLFLFFSLAWPMEPGREYWIYLEHAYGIISNSSFFRPAGASHILGWISEWSLPWIEWAFLAMYLTHLATSYYTARLFGVMTARVVTLIMLLNFSVLATFHRLDGYPLFCLATSIWTACVVHFFRSGSNITAFFLGLLTVLPLLMRQTGIILLLAIAFPLVCFGISRQTWLRSAMLALGVMVGLLGFSSYNYVHFDKFMITPPSGVIIPAFFVYRLAPKFSPEYGPHNQKLIKTIQEELLTQDVYVQNQVDLHQFMTHSLDMRKFGDLIYLDNVYPDILKNAAYESIRAKPAEFFKALFTSTWRMYINDALGPLPLAKEMPPENSPETTHVNGSDHPPTDSIKPNPKAIPISYSSRPDLARFTGTPYPPSKVDEAKIKDKINIIMKQFKTEGNYHIAFLIKYFLSTLMPPMLFFMLASFLLVFRIRSLEVRLLATLLVPAMLLIFASSFVNQLPEYRAPFDFLILLGGVVGLMGTRLNSWHFQERRQ